MGKGYRDAFRTASPSRSSRRKGTDTQLQLNRERLSGTALNEHDDELTPEEARAVLDLHHLRERLKDVQGGFVGYEDMRQVLGILPDELSKLVRHVRSVLPSRLTVQEDVLTDREAEFVVALHARSSEGYEPGAIDFPTVELVQVVRQRQAEFERYEGVAHAAGPVADYGVVVGEDPRSWTILLTVVGAIALTLAVLYLLFRS
ncbi:MAG: hypothetical protein JST30_08900 [Armatimonadetes bacterium]|nr:hypothetical protein [Armatimonadota bacterium]